MRQSFVLPFLGVMLLCASAPASVTTEPKLQPPALRLALPLKPGIFRLPLELTGGDPRPFSTEFYGVSPKAKKLRVPAAKKPKRTAQSQSGSI